MHGQVALEAQAIQACELSRLDEREPLFSKKSDDSRPLSFPVAQLS